MVVKEFLTQHSQKILKFPSTLEIAMSHLSAFEELGFVPVPLGKDRNDGVLYNLTKWKELNTIEDSKKSVEELYQRGKEIWGWAIRTGGVSSLVVIDVDDEEKFQQFLEEKGFSLEEVQECAFLVVRSKSGKGRHFYLRVSKDFADRVQSGQYQKWGFDIKAKDAIIDFVVWTRGEVQLCQVEDFKEQTEEDQLNTMAFLLPFINSLQNTAGIPHREVEAVYEVEQGRSVVDVVKRAYEAGEIDGWTVDANLTLWLVRHGASDEEIHSAMRYVYGSRYNERITSYMVARVRRLSDSLPYFRNFIELLRKAGVLRSRRTEQDSFWIVDDDGIKKVRKTKSGELRVEKSLPFVLDVIKRLELEDGAVAVCKYMGRTIYIPVSASRQEVNNLLRLSLSSKQYETLCEYLTYRLVSSPVEKGYSSIGWDKEDMVLKHPAREQNWMRLAGFNLEDFKEYEYDNAIEFIKKQIEQGTLWATLYVIALSSLIIKLRPSFMPFSVFLIGGSGFGKTTAGKLIQNAFLPVSFDINANATKNAIELTLSKLNNVPVLIDELAVSSQDEENLVFQISLGKGRTRGTAKLDVRVNDLASVVFFTSEKRPSFNRQGAIRRSLVVPVLHPEQLFGMPVDKIPVSVRYEWGHGLPVAEYLEEKLKSEGKDYLKKLEEKAKALITDELQPFYYILTTALSMSFIVEEALGISCEAVRQKIMELVKDGIREFKSKVEDIEQMFREWIIHNMNSGFIRLVVKNGHEGPYVEERFPRDKVIGKVEGQDVYILKNSLVNFCEYAGLDLEIVLRKLEQMGILVRTKQGKRLHKIRVEGLSVYAYRFYLPDVNKEQEGDGEESGELDSPQVAEVEGVVENGENVEAKEEANKEERTKINGVDVEKLKAWLAVYCREKDLKYEIRGDRLYILSPEGEVIDDGLIWGSVEYTMEWVETSLRYKEEGLSL